MSELTKQLQEATVATGIKAIHPSGNLVLLRPGAVRLGVKDGEPALVGLKDGWKLATSSDVAAKAKAAKDADAKRASGGHGGPSPKKAGA